MQYLVDIVFISSSGKPLCHGVDDGDDKVDYHGQKEVAKHPGEFAGFLMKRKERGGHMVLCLIPRSDAVGLGTSPTKMLSSHFRACVCVCVKGEERRYNVLESLPLLVVCGGVVFASQDIH